MRLNTSLRFLYDDFSSFVELPDDGDHDLNVSES